ncbi:MAG: hypothetical protein SGI99_00670 [Pseudomonadota bacterium]|nr:hypothetical protein [Pseudomonadota bacterium]
MRSLDKATVTCSHKEFLPDLLLVLRHVLPKGFRRARIFGFLHPNLKRMIALLHLLLKFDPGAVLVSSVGRVSRSGTRRPCCAPAVVRR